MQPAVVEHHLIAAEQVLQLDAADLRYCDFARQQVVVGRHGEDRQPRSAGGFRCTPAHSRGRSRQRDDRMAGLQLLRPAADFAESPKHPHAQKDLPVPGRVIVEYADRTPLTGAPHLPQQIDGDVAGADHEHRFAGEVNVAVQSALLPGAIGDPAARHDRGKEKRCEDERGARHVDVGAEERKQRGHCERSDQAGERYMFQVGQARVAPAAPVQAQRPEYQGVQGNGRRYRRGKRREKLLWGGFQVEAQPERKHPANSGSEHVVRKGECSSVTGLKRIQWICSRVAATRSPPTARALRGARPAR